jgi:hypothetical protein
MVGMLINKNKSLYVRVRLAQQGEEEFLIVG